MTLIRKFGLILILVAVSGIIPGITACSNDADVLEDKLDQVDLVKKVDSAYGRNKDKESISQLFLLEEYKFNVEPKDKNTLPAVVPQADNEQVEEDIEQVRENLSNAIELSQTAVQDMLSIA